MENPFRGDRFINQVIAWTSSALVIPLAVRVLIGNHSGLTKALAVAVAIAVVGRSLPEMFQRGGKR